MIRQIALAASIFLGSSFSASATVYDAIANFSSTNPGLIWSYQTSRNGTITSLPTYIPNSPTLGSQWWSGGAIPYSGAIWKNGTGSPLTHLTIVTPASYIGMDPEAYDWVSVTFSAPAAGVYQFSGEFRGIDTAQYQHLNQIIVGSTQAFSASIGGYGQVQSFSGTANLTAGETISFRTLTAVSPSSPSAYSNLATGLRLTITSSPVPEPSNWAMMVCAFGMMGAVMRRRSGDAVAMFVRFH